MRLLENRGLIFTLGSLVFCFSATCGLLLKQAPRNKTTSSGNNLNIWIFFILFPFKIILSIGQLQCFNDTSKLLKTLYQIYIKGFNLYVFGFADRKQILDII
jgi:hypothetical protein